MVLEDDYVAGNPRYNGTELMVVISGCSGGGKSSLLTEMAARGFPIRPEPGRQIVKEQLYIGGDALPWANTRKFAELCVWRALYFYNTADPTEKPILFDRSIVDNIAGLQRVGLDVPDYLEEALKRYRYAPKVYVVPPWRELFVVDVERRHSFEEAQAEYESLLDDYPAAGYDVVIIPKGTVRERADFLEEQLSR